MAREKPTALDLLASLSVDELQEQIAERENALAELVAGQRKEIDALGILLKAALVARDGNPKRGPRQKTAGKESKAKPENQNRIRIADWLGKHPPATVGAIARALTLPPGPVSRLVDHEWFVRIDGDGEELIGLARAG